MIESTAGGRNCETRGNHPYRHPVATMAHLTAFAVHSGRSIGVYVEDSAGPSVTRQIGEQSITTRASWTFEGAISRARPASEATVAQLQGLASTPDEVAVEFGRLLSAEAGARPNHRRLPADEL
jgi:hypothetical protein